MRSQSEPITSQKEVGHGVSHLLAVGYQTIMHEDALASQLNFSSKFVDLVENIEL